MSTYAVILAGGNGTRMGVDIPKQYLSINGKPIIIYSAEVFQNHNYIDGIIVICSNNYIDHVKGIFQQYKISKLIKVCYGGATRQLSSYNSVKLKECKNDDIILIHDAARPFISSKIITNLINSVKDDFSSAVYVNMSDSIIRTNSDFVEEYIPRNEIYYAQTPQAFKKRIILECHQKAINENIEFTDDASMVHHYGYQVKKVAGDKMNFKITTTEDLNYAEYVLKQY